jgi:hypothetical protein
MLKKKVITARNFNVKVQDCLPNLQKIKVFLSLWPRKKIKALAKEKNKSFYCVTKDFIKNFLYDAKDFIKNQKQCFFRVIFRKKSPLATLRSICSL